MPQNNQGNPGTALQYTAGAYRLAAGVGGSTGTQTYGDDPTEGTVHGQQPEDSNGGSGTYVPMGGSQGSDVQGGYGVTTDGQVVAWGGGGRNLPAVPYSADLPPVYRQVGGFTGRGGVFQTTTATTDPIWEYIVTVNANLSMPVDAVIIDEFETRINNTSIKKYVWKGRRTSYSGGNYDEQEKEIRTYLTSQTQHGGLNLKESAINSITPLEKETRTSSKSFSLAGPNAPGALESQVSMGLLPGFKQTAPGVVESQTTAASENIMLVLAFGSEVYRVNNSNINVQVINSSTSLYERLFSTTSIITQSSNFGGVSITFSKQESNASVFSPPDPGNVPIASEDAPLDMGGGASDY